MRLLKISTSKRTILVNRGQEDGINVDDQAKFYLTTGIIARGIVVKVTPSRSIWSMYRIIKRENLLIDSLVKIKKTATYNLTNDKTRELKESELNKAIPLAPGATEERNELNGLSPLSKSDHSNGMPSQMSYRSSQLTKKSTEFFAQMSFNSLNSNFDLGNGTSGTGVNSTSDYTLGFEKYFHSKGILSKFSIYGFIHKLDSSVMSSTGQTISIGSLEYGAGSMFHFGNSPFRINRMIFFANFDIAIGSSTDILNLSNSGVSNTSDYQLNGKSSSITFGGGAKYVTQSSFTFRVLVNFYSKNETFPPPSSASATDFLKTTSGMRIQFGLGKRF